MEIDAKIDTLAQFLVLVRVSLALISKNNFFSSPSQISVSDAVVVSRETRTNFPLRTALSQPLFPFLYFTLHMPSIFIVPLSRLMCEMLHI